MELRNLKLFVDVAATGSFSRAATLAELTQSSVSKAVSQLEVELGARLFDRTGRGALLTEAGRALLPRATALLADAQSLRVPEKFGSHNRLFKIVTPDLACRDRGGPVPGHILHAAGAKPDRCK